MAIFKSLTFDGINSLDYGIYITGEAVYNAPERVVEMVSVPGRNGDIAIDQGRFENIEVTYPAGCFADSQADFADKVMKFRNALASRYTYKRLTDEYHSDEYRLGLYKSGLDVDAVRYGTAGQFDITFDCKPQRFLLSGETAVTPSDYGNPQTETGEIVTIDSDGSLGVKALEVALSPIQDLNGYDVPWVGGAGKNKLPLRTAGTSMLNGLTITYNGDGTITVNGTATANTDISIYNSGNISQGLQGAYVLNGSVGGTSTTYRIAARIRDTSAGTNRYVAVLDGDLSVTTSTNEVISSIYIVVSSGVTLSNKVFYPMLRLASEADATFAPYENICPISGHTEVVTIVSPTTSASDGQTYTTALGRTVYGGTLDVVSGVLTVDKAMVTIDGDESITQVNGSKNCYISMNDMARQADYRASMRSNGFEVTKSGGDATVIDSPYWVAGYFKTSAYEWQNWLYFHIDGANSLTEVRTYLASNPLQVVYELATPQTYQLTAQQIELLVGENHVWSDGEITVEYGTHPYYNPTQFESKPLIVVTGKGVLQIGDYVLTIGGTDTQTLYIDCDLQEAWEVVGAGKISRNDYIRNAGEEFPVLMPGINNISVGSGISNVTITPRWWRL